MPSPVANIALLDRRVEILEGASGRSDITRVSHLRDCPYVVLVGEPGSGKSSALQNEAGHAGKSVVKVHELMIGLSAGERDVLFLDALDEYRMDGQEEDKVLQLAKTLRESSVSRWRVTCRSEDWRKGADLSALSRASSGEQVIVAKLLPLDQDEARAILLTLGEAAPDAFIAKASTRGASSLLGSPLRLKLLHKVVTRDNRWPVGRYELFSAAVQSLAHEHNEKYQFRPRTTPAGILSAAERASLLLLLAGARAIWRSNGESPDASFERKAFLPAHELGLDHSVISDMLDTGLFAGEGEEFEPVHRTIAEFLGGCALANAVHGDQTRAAFPLSRALAVITGPDVLPPTELRGLYAWFVCHLSQLAETARARQLIEKDAATVLFYGDAAILRTEERRTLLQNLDRLDPYFLASESPDSAISGLAKPDLVPEFRQILEASTVESHHLLTVFEALTHAETIPELRPLLRQIALDPKRPEWHRVRAAEAWLNDSGASPRKLFNELAGEPNSPAREALRLHLATKFAADLTINEIQSVLADFERTPDDNTVGRLIEFAAAVAKNPVVQGLFDVSVGDWLPSPEARRHSVELEHALDVLFAAAILRDLQLPAARLWKLINNARRGIWQNLHEKAQDAIRVWLDHCADRERELFNVILADTETEEHPAQPPNAFIVATGRPPSPALARSLLACAKSASPEHATRLEGVAVEIARSSPDTELYADTHAQLLASGIESPLLERLRSGAAERARIAEEQRTEERDEETQKARASNVRILTPLLDELKVGRFPHHLSWAAEVYFSHSRNRAAIQGDMTRLEELLDPATFNAILEGWEHLSTRELVEVDAGKLAKADAENRRFYVEWPAMAGLHRRLRRAELPPFNKTTIIIALVVMRSAGLVRDLEERKQLLTWALDFIDAHPEVGAKALSDFWIYALDCGAKRLEPLWQLGENGPRRPAIADALDALLSQRSNMHPEALRPALRAGTAHLGAARLKVLAEQALSNDEIKGSQRRIWSFVAFALDPENHCERFLTEHRDEAAQLFDEDIRQALLEPFRNLHDSTLTLRETTIIRLLARSTAPEQDGEGWYFTGAVQTVRGAIALLSRTPLSNAGSALASLASDTELTPWRPAFRHAHATWAAQQREKSFRHPRPAEVTTALDGGPPVNSADLFAVVIEELRGLGDELHSGDSTPWKNYWNLSSYGKPIDPVIENECRNRLLLLLRERLRRYDIAAALPESRQREDSRADVIVLSHAGRSLPVEVKRHYHREVWTAPTEQLMGYVQTQGADGYGIYLVFWFGHEIEEPPKRVDGQSPRTASEMGALLIDDLAPELRDLLRVIVLDVSPPASH